MNNTNIKLHKYQKEILKTISTEPSFRFNDLLIEGLESEHMNYHLKKLIEFGFVQKKGSEYSLTDSGKDYRNLMDDDVKVIEKQPKTSVIIKAVRKNKHGEVEYLLSKRLVQPYLGKVGRLGGKVRFGETLEEAVSRELYEETGLKANNITLEQIYRKMRRRDKGGFIQDVFFYIYHCTELEGEIIEQTEFQENFWATVKEATKMNTYDDLSLPDTFEPAEFDIQENLGIAEGF